MTTLNLSKTKPPVITNVSSIGAVRQINLSWDPLLEAPKYEVLRNTGTNDFTTATPIGITETNTFIDNDMEALSGAYYWVRGVTNKGTTGQANNEGSSSLVGSAFNNLKLRICAMTSAAATVSIQNVKARLYWVNDDLSTGNSGLIDFSTSVTQSSTYAGDWTDPGNARVDDSNYATITTAGAMISEDLIFTLSDLGMPATSTVVGLQVQVKAKSTDVSETVIYSQVANDDLSFYWEATEFGALTTDGVDDTKSIGGSSDMLKMDAIMGKLAEPTSFASSYSAASVTSGTSMTVGSGFSNISTPISSFIPKNQGPVLVFGSVYLDISHGCTGDQTITVDIKVTLRNETTSTNFKSYTYSKYYVASASGASVKQNQLNIMLNTAGSTINIGDQYSVKIDYEAVKTGTGTPTPTYDYTSTNVALTVFTLTVA